MKKLFAEFVQNNSNGNFEICLQIFQAQSLLMQKVILIGEVNTQRVAKIVATHLNFSFFNQSQHNTKQTLIYSFGGFEGSLKYMISTGGEAKSYT